MTVDIPSTGKNEVVTALGYLMSPAAFKTSAWESGIWSTYSNADRQRSTPKTIPREQKEPER